MPGVLIKSIAPKSRSFVVSVFVVTLAKLPVAQRLDDVPILYVLSTSGIISLAISALIKMLSVSSLPIVILPSALIFPVACRLPLTVVLPIMLISPVPFARINKSLLVFVFSIKLLLSSKSPTITLLPTIVLSAVAIENSCAVVEIVLVAPLIVTLPTWNVVFVISKSVTLAVPAMSNAY